MTRTARGKFKTFVDICSPLDILAKMVAEAREADEAHAELIVLLNRIRELNKPGSGFIQWKIAEGKEEAFETLRAKSAAKLSELRFLVEKLRGAIGTREEFELDWYMLESRWQFLSSDVRVLRYSKSLRWVPVQHEAVFNVRIAGVRPPQLAAHVELNSAEAKVQKLSETLQGDFATIARITDPRQDEETSPDRPMELHKPCATAQTQLINIRNAAHEAEPGQLDQRAPVRAGSALPGLAYHRSRVSNLTA